MITSKKKKFIKLKQRKNKDVYMISFYPFCITDDISKARSFYPFAKLVVFFHNIWYPIEMFSVVNGLSINADFDSRFNMLEDQTLRGKSRRFLLFIVRLIERLMKWLMKDEKNNNN